MVPVGSVTPQPAHTRARNFELEVSCDTRGIMLASNISDILCN